MQITMLTLFDCRPKIAVWADETSKISRTVPSSILHNLIPIPIHQRVLHTSQEVQQRGCEIQAPDAIPLRPLLLT